MRSRPGWCAREERCRHAPICSQCGLCGHHCSCPRGSEAAVLAGRYDRLKDWQTFEEQVSHAHLAAMTDLRRSLEADRATALAKVEARREREVGFFRRRHQEVVAALRFYGERRNWMQWLNPGRKGRGHPNRVTVYNDKGHRAREALAGLESAEFPKSLAT